MIETTDSKVMRYKTNRIEALRDSKRFVTYFNKAR